MVPLRIGATPPPHPSPDAPSPPDAATPMVMREFTYRRDLTDSWIDWKCAVTMSVELELHYSGQKQNSVR